MDNQQLEQLAVVIALLIVPTVLSWSLSPLSFSSQLSLRWWWWLLGGWLNKKNVGAVGFDMVCQVISVGTCCPNSHIQSWAGSLVVERVITVPTKVEGSNP